MAMTASPARQEVSTPQEVFEPFVVPPAMREIGRRIREVRLARHMTQTELARLLDVAKQTVSNWESGAAPPMLISLIRLAAVLNVNIAYVIGVTDLVIMPPEKSKEASNQLVPLYTIDIAGGVLMQTEIEPSTDRYVAPVAFHPRDAIAFTNVGKAMAPRFQEGDTVTISPQTMTEPGSLVLAYAGGRFVFRKFLPKVEGRVDGARLVAFNGDYPDIVMNGTKDAILGRMVEHVSHSHD